MSDSVHSGPVEEFPGITNVAFWDGEALGVAIPRKTELKRRENVLITNFRRIPSMPNLGERIAISVESAQKRFGDLRVLEGLNMHVQEGTIYGLLGPSGCGKTTLLSCLVGLRKLDSGQIRICGKSPGEPGSGVPGRLMGYMPQEIALNAEFTTREVAHFFGLLYGLSRDKVEERLCHLLALLELEKSSKEQIGKLSGGQKRRASFLVALLHEPQILILDEPTVGVDPILSNSIWTHLRNLVAKFGTTVIITTHYIEEMRHADTIGIMKDGVLMAEDSPKQLLETHNATMLEDVVLQYCLKTVENETAGVATSSTNRRRATAQSNLEEIELGNQSSWRARSSGSLRPPQMATPNLNLETTHAFQRTSALVYKNVLVLLRSIVFLLFIFVTPAAVLLIYSFCIGADPKEVGIGILNEENVDCRLAGSRNAQEMAFLARCSPQNLSCAFVNALEATGAFTIHFYEGEKSALENIEKRNIMGFAHFGSNFSRHFYDRTLGLELTNETIEGSKIQVRLDMSIGVAGHIVQKMFFESYKVFVRNLLTNCNRSDMTEHELPISYQKPIYGAVNMKIRNFIGPGVTQLMIVIISTLTAGLGLIIEKKDGMFDRVKVAGVTTLEVMMSHFIPQVGVIFVQNLIAYLIMFLWLDNMRLGSVYLAFTISIWMELSGIILGLMISALVENEKVTLFIAIAYGLIISVLTGIIFPVEGLGPIARKVAYFLPGTLEGESVRSILLRGWDLSHFSVYMGFITPLIFTTLYVSVIFVAIKIRK